ncbi:MAG: hypothetical protein NZ528_07905 [Caldilineales bacterium]|nr:hypothetical protein [Caldilineales bacterium]MDW8318911.1 BTAD domain-containing putative transcriptional regulator [Anaerolineae bacterium]
MTIQIHLLGRFEAISEGVPLVGIEAHRAQELLCYLLLYRNRSHARETVAGVLWGDASTGQARKHLRQALWQLQAALGSRNGHDPRWLVVEPEWLRLNSDPTLVLDVEMLEQAYAPARDTPGETLTLAQAQALNLAVELYRGDLLEGWYQDWCLFERERLQNIYLAMLQKLVACCEAHQEYEQGIAYGMRILSVDYAHERAHRRLMRLHYLRGDRTAALRQFERCQQALARELAVQPARSTVLLAEQIRRGQPLTAQAAAPRAPQPESDEATLAAVLERLRQVQRALAAAQQQVAREIQNLESLL